MNSTNDAVELSIQEKLDSLEKKITEDIIPSNILPIEEETEELKRESEKLANTLSTTITDFDAKFKILEEFTRYANF